MSIDLKEDNFEKYGMIFFFPSKNSSFDLLLQIQFDMYMYIFVMYSRFQKQDIMCDAFIIIFCCCCYSMNIVSQCNKQSQQNA